MGVMGTLLPGYRKVNGTFQDRYNFQTLCFPTYELKHCTVNIVNLGFMYVFCVWVGSIFIGYRNVSIG